MDQKVDEAALQACEEQIKQLQVQLDALTPNFEESLETLPMRKAADADNLPKLHWDGEARAALKGHYGKIYALHWGGENSDYLVSAAQDGNVIVWDAPLGQKACMLRPRSSWVMTCAYSPDGSYVASGGLDNICSLFRVKVGEKDQSPTKELSVHEGYLSCIRFINPQKFITSSGDSTCVLWDVNKGAQATFSGADGDIMCVSINPTNPDLFVSGSVDSLSRLHDIRTGSVVGCFRGHESDVNWVDYHPDGQSFASASDDTRCMMFDTRAYTFTNVYRDEKAVHGVTCCSFSKSGRMLFAGHDESLLRVWDTAYGDAICDFDDHTRRVSCLQVSPDGNALATGSWDQSVLIWA